MDHLSNPPRPGTLLEPDHAPSRSGGAPIWLWIITLALLAFAVFLQRPEPAAPLELKAAETGMVIKPASGDEFVLLGKLLLAVKKVSPLQVQMFQQLLDEQAKATGSATDKLRVAILQREAAGDEAMLTRLDELDATLDEASPLKSDVTVLRRVAASAEPEQPPEPASPAGSPIAESEFRARHGWFADLALSPVDGASALRDSAVRDGYIILTVFGLFGLIVMAAMLTGIVLLIIALVMLNQGRLRPAFVPPQPAGAAPPDDHLFGWRQGTPPSRGRSVWLETLAVFLAGFIALQLIATAIGHYGNNEPWTAWVSLLGQWLILPTIFWPIVRGMSFQRWAGEIGWHKGRGVLREIGAGVVGYLTFLPIYFILALLVAAFLIARKAITGQEPMPPGGENKVVDIVTQASPLMLLAVFLLATMWAPIVEEGIFRGALYRHLRGRSGLILSALITGTAFAVLHGYMVVQLFLVGALGLMFCLLREWRGSLIAPMTAHWLHNTTLLTLMIIVLSMTR